MPVIDPRVTDTTGDMSPAQHESRAKPATRKRRRQDDHGERASSHVESNPDSTTVNGRKRAPMACQVCRARKVKCSNERPACAGCIRLGCDCIYPEVVSYGSNS